MKLAGLQKDALENICLFKIQMDNRNSQGRGDETSKCFHCKSYDLHCPDYTPVKSQRDLVFYMDREGFRLGVTQ